jgi:orotate phosphoribosyltransferase
MTFHTIPDLTAVVARSGPLLPRQVDVVVGTSGSGLFAATLFSLHLNCALCSLEHLLAGRTIEAGRTRRHPRLKDNSHEGECFLVVTDVLGDGSELELARKEIAASGLRGDFHYLAVYGADPGSGTCIVIEQVESDAQFGWRPSDETCSQWSPP